MQPVLELFLEQLALLKDPMGPNYTEAFGLLERLTEIRGFMLIFDCPDPESVLQSTFGVWFSQKHEDEEDQVIISLVTTCLEAARAKMGSSDGQLESLLTPLLTNILGEADELPKHALGELLEELMTKRKGAASLVRRVLGGLAEGSAAVPINDYLNKALFWGSKKCPEPGFPRLQRGYKISQERLEGILCATSELYSIQPSLVARVLPNLQADLQNVNPDRRRATTAVIGQILAYCHPVSEGQNVSTSETHLQDRFRDRLGDADDGVRMTALEGAAGVLQSAIAQVATAHPVVAVGESLREKILERCLDPNDAIRLRAVEIVTEAALASEAGVRFLLPILPDACRRILDKKPRVREACAEASAKLYAKHALPRWTEGNYQAGQELNWIPQLLCEAYAAFCSSRLGYVAQLEEHIEQHVLGCGAGLSEGQRALALLGFYSSAAQGTEAAVHGLQTLLAKKRDAHRALRRYIQKRSEKAAPLGEADAGSSLVLWAALVPHEVAAAEPHSRPEAIEWLEQLGRLSPTMDDKYTRPEVLAAHIRAFDAVRDKGLWKQLEKLLEPAGQESTAQLAGSLQELDRLLRVHRLAELAPLLRRALVSTWLLPDQVAELLNIWKSSPEVLDEAPSSELVAAAGITIANLAKSFPGAFMPFVGELAKLLPESSAEDAKVILQTLAAIAKRADLEPSQLEAQNLSQTLLEALSLSESSSMASLSRKVAKIMLLLSEKDCCQVSLELLKWAEENKEASESKLQALSLQLAAALLEWSRRHPHFPHLSVEPWLAEARRVLSQPNGERDENTSMVQCAAADLLAAAGSAEDVAKILLAPKAKWPWFDPLPVHAACAALRAIRLGTVESSTLLLARMGGRLVAAMGTGRPTIDPEKLLQSLLTMKRSSSASKLKPAERLRVCTALPAVFALASLKRHRDAAQLMLQGSLRAAWQGPQTELLDFAVACFVHFLSRLDVFKKEVAEKVSAFPDSSKVAAFFCDALLRCDVQHSAELLGVALRVCDRVRYFVDREDPSSDAVHRAGCVLRYVCEKRCPELGLQGAQLLQGAAPWILSERGGTCGGGWNVRQEFGWTIPVNGN
ncbi:Sister chromatid cohesion protein PDS5 homolog A [Durusdinium trenchii]|uniref:Sister chromatid cohesion protein PDS5 homolog A n=1 Tax=Durusdinium trenchii TaxID=1381693 RepID=A0ABP0Q526_9DINO